MSIIDIIKAVVNSIKAVINIIKARLSATQISMMGAVMIGMVMLKKKGRRLQHGVEEARVAVVHESARDD